MVEIIKTLDISYLKQRARNNYLAFHRKLDELDCGVELAKHICNDLNIYASNFNRAMEELQTIDASAPKNWSRL